MNDGIMNDGIMNDGIMNDAEAEEYIQELTKAADNEENSAILNMTTEKINEIKTTMLGELNFTEEKFNKIFKQLEDYMYVDEIPDLRYGAYIRWIPLKDVNNLNLKRGAVICDLTITETGSNIKCKSINNNFIFDIKIDNCFIFRKLTYQEQILLSAMDHLSKS